MPNFFMHRPLFRSCTFSGADQTGSPGRNRDAGRKSTAFVRTWPRCASATIRRRLFTSETRFARAKKLAYAPNTTRCRSRPPLLELLDLIASLNARDDVDGILTQLPLPRQIDETAIIEAIDPRKDVDGFHPVNVGKLAMGRPVFVPCTPAGIIELLDDSGVEIRGANACVVGRSQIVGRPMAQLLLQRDATVTICHSRTRDLAAVTRTADLLVSQSEERVSSVANTSSRARL